MKTVYLVACVSKKGKQSAPAKSLYQSDWFFKASQYATQNADSWYILSAKHGLLHPDKIIEPYNKTLTQGIPKAERIIWADIVYRDLISILKIDDRLVFLAGEKYREFLLPRLREAGYTIEIPMYGLQIGKQLAWLKQNLET